MYFKKNSKKISLALFSGLLKVYLLLLPMPIYAAGSLAPLGTLNGGTATFVDALSANGTVAVGFAQDGNTGQFTAFRTTSSGLVAIGQLNGGFFSEARAVNTNGSVIVGSAIDGSDIQSKAFRWTQATGMVGIANTLGGTTSSAGAVNADGSVLAGFAFNGLNQLQAFRWTQATGMVSLTQLHGGNSSEARGISANGQVIVGIANDGTSVPANTRTAFRWSQATGMQGLMMLNNGDFGIAVAVSDNTAIIAGSANDGAAAEINTLVIWNNGIIEPLGRLKGGDFIQANAMNGAGTVIVGDANNVPGGPAQGIRWSRATGILSVEDWLRANGVNVPADITGSATGVNSDGSIVVGVLSATPDSYIARVINPHPNNVIPSPNPHPNNGLISFSNLNQSLTGVASIPLALFEMSGMLLHGAHGYPLSNLILGDCDHNVWVAGDWGHLANSTNGGLAEVGVSQRLNPWLQGSVGIGVTRDRQGLNFSGDSHLAGTYGLAEFIANYRCFYATLTGFYQWGRMTINRGYINAGNLVSSTGSPRIQTSGARFRVDWRNMLAGARTSLSPYLDISSYYGHINTFTEAGGGFPARFNARSLQSSDARLGVRAEVQSGCQTKLFAMGEWVYNFSRKFPLTNGQLLGLFIFSVSPQISLPRQWVRGGVGLEQKIGDGIASIAVNATSKGLDPRYWVAASYHLSF